MEKEKTATFLEKITTIHGTNHFNPRAGKNRITWGLVMVGNLMMTLTFITVIKDNYQDDQILTKIDATCQVSQVPFPAVSICNFNMVSMRDTANIVRILKLFNRTDKEINKFFTDLPNLKNYASAGADSAIEIMDILKRNYYTMDTIMEEMEKEKTATFLEKITTIHGTNHFNPRAGKNRITWGLVMVGNLMMTLTFITVIKDNYQDDQILTKIDATCQVSQVPFPAVSICNFNMVSMRDTANIVRILKLFNRTDKEINKFFADLPNLKNYASAGADSAIEIMDILKRNYYTMDTIMEEVYQRCENLLLYCTFNRKVKNCDDIFNLIKTVEGHCCAFNYAALNDASEDPLLQHDDTLEYYDADEEDAEVMGPIIATSESGRTSGLEVVFNVEPNEYPSWSKAINYGAMILISDPNDFPETSVRSKFVTTGTSVDIKVEARVYQSDPELRRVPVERRGCWFHDEVVLEHTDRYSYETCCTECSMNNFIRACGCTPYKYPREESRRFCELEDLPCLNNLTVYGKAAPCDPVCYVECRDKGYEIKPNVVPFFIENFPPNITNHSTSHLASIRVFFGKSTCNCYKLTLLMDLDYFIATYGGVLSLSFGASLLTFVELLYLLISFLIHKFNSYFNCCFKNT